MTIRFLSVMGGAALVLAACGGSQEPGTVPADNPILEYEAPESGGEDDDLFADDAFDDLDEADGPGDGAGEDEDDSDQGASKSTASDEGASARAERDAAEGSGKASQAE